MTQKNNEVAYIVGGSSGIGMATAQLLLEKGINVCIIGRSPAQLTNAYHHHDDDDDQYVFYVLQYRALTLCIRFHMYNPRVQYNPC